MASSDIRLFLLLLLVGLLAGQRQAQVNGEQVGEGGLLTPTTTSYEMNEDDDDQDDLFHDASSEFDDEDTTSHEDEDEMFYDGESDEIGFDEEAEENACATSSSHDCQTCCSGQGFDLPYWNKSIGQCFCYVSHGEQNICKQLASETNDACRKCCLEHGYKDWDYPGHEDACYCSIPDYQVFFSSLKFTLKREAAHH